MPSQVVQLHLGEIWNPVANPFARERPADCLETFPKGALAIDGDGRVAALGVAADLRRAHPAAALHDHGDALLLPGFVDGHLHFPQLDIIGCHGEQLLGWLNKYTFPAECAFADPAVARAAAPRLVTELLANGTTTAMIFSSSHAAATEILFEEALHRGLRAIIGKVGMDRNAPAGLLQDPEGDALDHERLIAAWHGRAGRLFYALTPRFAPACSPAMLASHGELLRRHPGVYLQTHYAENLAELAWVAELFPQDHDYLAVYERFGLLGPRSVFAHVIHAGGDALDRFRKAGSIAAHCPTSNMFLGSGLFPLEQLVERGIPLALGTDIGGGTSLSIWRTLDEAYKVQQLRGRSLSPVHLLWLATLGGAESLGLGDVTGNFVPGKSADFQVIDWRRHRLLAPRFERQPDPIERLFALVMLADDRLVRSVHIQGRQVHNLPT